jgi:hypothetical protein
MIGQKYYRKDSECFLLENTNFTLANMTQELFSTDGQRFSHCDGPIKFRCHISNNF